MVLATPSMACRSASPLGSGGVPTQMKIAFPQAIASSVDPKRSRPAWRAALITFSRYGSENRHSTVLQFLQLLEIAFTAKHVMTDLCQASRSGESYIACAND